MTAVGRCGRGARGLSSYAPAYATWRGGSGTKPVNLEEMGIRVFFFEEFVKLESWDRGTGLWPQSKTGGLKTDRDSARKDSTEKVSSALQLPHGSNNSIKIRACFKSSAPCFDRLITGDGVSATARE